MSDEWILYDISDRLPSRNENDEFFILKFFNTRTKEKNSVYITVGYRNNDWWGRVIIDDLFGIYKFKSFQLTRTGLINGDSIPVLVNRTSYAEANAIVEIMSGAAESMDLSGASL